MKIKQLTTLFLLAFSCCLLAGSISCSRKTGCPINEDAQVKTSKSGNFDVKKSKSSLFPKKKKKRN